MNHSLIWLFMIILLLDVVLLAFFLVLRISEEGKRTLQDLLEDRIYRMIQRTLENPEAALRGADRIVLFLLRKFVMELLMKEKWLGTSEDDLKIVLQQWGFLKLLSKKIRSRRWWVKLETLHFISVFHLTSFKASVKPLLRHGNPFVEAKAFRVLGTLGDIGDLPDMLAIIREYQNERYRLDLMVNLLEKLAIEGSEQNLADFLQLYDQSQDILTKTVLLHLAASKFKHKSLPFLKDQLRNEHAEIKIAAIKGMAKAEIYPKRELVELLDSDHADVQIVSLKALSMMKNSHNLKIFERCLLTNDNWWLNYYAGFGLAAMGREGLDRLKALKTVEQDEQEATATAEPFVDYFLQILQEEGYVWETLKRSLKIF